MLLTETYSLAFQDIDKSEFDPSKHVCVCGKTLNTMTSPESIKSWIHNKQKRMCIITKWVGMRWGWVGVPKGWHEQVCRKSDRQSHVTYLSN